MSGSCAGIGCEEPAKMQCPTCIKLKLEPTFFCSQSCFKSNWVTHKACHKKTSGIHDPWPMYMYTGDLRPAYPLSDSRRVPSHIGRPDYAEDGLPKSEMERRGRADVEALTAAQIKKVRKVCKLAREVLDIAGKAVRPGITTDELDRIVHEACVERNSYPSPLNYHGFPKSCCTSVNEVICHGIPDHRPLVEGDIVNIDVTLFHNGVHGDMNETFFVGKPDEVSEKLVRTTYECLQKAIALVKPGTLYRDIGDVIQRHAQANGFSVVRTYCGHGISELFHTSPNVPHYSKNKAVGVMKPGHCFTIEPMISEGTYRDKLWPDDWTAVTNDGKRSAQFEHQMIVTETGVEVLSENVNKIPGFEIQLEALKN